MGTLLDNRRLYDITIRLQIYIERVKLWQAAEFKQSILAANQEFKRLLHNLKFNTLDGLTKGELNLLVMKLRKAQLKIYSTATESLLKQLEMFMHVALHVNRIVYASAYLDEDDDIEPVELSDSDAFKLIEEQNKKNDFIFLFGIGAIRSGSKSTLWPTIKNHPVPANGALLPNLVKATTISNQVQAENTIRKGYSNAHTISETIAEGLTDTVRAINGSSAIIATSMQHIATMVSESITSGLFGRYEWISVIDSGTTDICRSRNHLIYEYGRGPVPPAHIRCRSSIVPFRGKESPKETFGAWLERQSPKIQDVALGAAVGKQFREGKVAKADVHKLANISPMSIDQFKASTSIILLGK